MTFGSTNLSGTSRPDFWELTNFGTNAVNLGGYQWSDADNTSIATRQPLPTTTIRPGESIIIVKDGNTMVLNTNDFHTWWGPNLPSDLQIYFGNNAPGLDSSNGDAVRLWDGEGNLVDEARFASGRVGVTFTYETEYGAFSEFSQEGVAGAFRAVLGGDIGSPGYGTNKGPVALRFTQQPVGSTNDPGSEVILKVQATGRPSPQYQWYTNGEPIETTGANPSTIPRLVCFADCGPSWRRAPSPNDLVLPAVQLAQSGDYSVEIFNGLERLTSAVVKVTVNTNPSPIRVECPPGELCAPCSGTDSPANLVARPGQTATFTVRNRGFPLPTFQWSRSADGITFTDIPGQNSRDLEVSNLQPSDAGLYRVRLENPLGATNAYARLTVQPPPALEITEAMAWACSGIDLDWWELTNTGSEPVNLCGYRWDDDTARDRVTSMLTIGGGPTITNDVTVLPGESVILLESQSAESFRQWWGASNLPPNLQFITYAANGLGETFGDSVYLWDPNETDAPKYVTSVVFSGMNQGVTRWFDSFIALQTDYWCGDPSSGTESIQGYCGTFKADQRCEIGSPGWTRLTPPMLTSVRREGGSAVLAWRAQPGSRNKVQYAHQLAVPLSATIWQDLDTFQFSSATCSATDSTIGAEPQRFYRVVRVSAANCPCP